ncbi:MAG: RNA polymerase sigma factor [Gemmobacter sp.]
MTADPRTIEAVYRSERRRVLATLIRLLGSFDAAEEASQEAFLIAARKWPETGIPANPYAWLVSTGRFHMVDRWRRRARLAAAVPEMARLAEMTTETADPDEIRDDELRLIFTCCHPALPQDAQIALTLREVAGLTTEEVARALLTRAPTIAQRIVRAKARIRDDGIPYAVPAQAELSNRLEVVLRVLYLIFNQGHGAFGAQPASRGDLCVEAMRLAQLVSELVKDPEALGLLALMQLHMARMATRVDKNGDLVLLKDQDRSLWDHKLIADASALIERALSCRSAGTYLLQAMIVATHARSSHFDETDWPQIVALYDRLMEADPSPVIALNRAVAVGMRDGPDEGLVQVERIMVAGKLAAYAPAHAARAQFLMDLGRGSEALCCYRHALEHVATPAERRHFEMMCRSPKNCSGPPGKASG